MTKEQQLLLEIAKSLSQFFRDYDITQFPNDEMWERHQKAAYRLDYLVDDIKTGEDNFQKRIEKMEKNW